MYVGASLYLYAHLTQQEARLLVSSTHKGTSAKGPGVLLTIPSFQRIKLSTFVALDGFKQIKILKAVKLSS